MSVLLVGLGGGGLPQFLHDFVACTRVEVVELDPAVLEVAQTWFGFQNDKRLKVILGDGLEHIKTLESQGERSSRLIILNLFDSKIPCCPQQYSMTYWSSILWRRHGGGFGF